MIDVAHFAREVIEQVLCDERGHDEAVANARVGRSAARDDAPIVVGAIPEPCPSFPILRAARARNKQSRQEFRIHSCQYTLCLCGAYEPRASVKKSGEIAG